MGDLAANIYQQGGYCTCHGQNGLLDLLLDHTGDLAIIDDPVAQLLQEIQIWWGTKLGERINPDLGCIIHKFNFHRMHQSELVSLEIELKQNFMVNFPEFSSAKVQAHMYSPTIVFVAVKIGILGAGFLVDKESADTFSYQIGSMIGASRGPTIG